MRKRIWLALTLLWSVGLLLGCSAGGNTWEAKSYTPEGAAVGGIDIQVSDREILVIPSDDARLHIDYAENAKEFYEISVSDGGILTMVSERDLAWTDYIGVRGSDGADRITVRIPDAALSTLTLRTTRGSISLPALTVTDQLILSTNGGDISFEQVSAAGSITVENKNGDIAGSIAGHYEDYAIACTVKKGKSNLPDEKDGGSKTLTVQNNNGDIDIAFVAEPAGQPR